MTARHWRTCRSCAAINIIKKNLNARACRAIANLSMLKMTSTTARTPFEIELREYLFSSARVAHAAAKQPISSREKHENGSGICINGKCVCKACKTTVFFLLLNMQISDILVCRHRPGCLSSLTGSLRSYDGCCDENDTLKYNFSLGYGKCFYDYSIFVALYEKCTFAFGTNGFHLKAENEKIIAAGLRCRQNLKYENFTSSFGRLRQKLHQKACRTCS